MQLIETTAHIRTTDQWIIMLYNALIRPHMYGSWIGNSVDTIFKLAYRTYVNTENKRTHTRAHTHKHSIKKEAIYQNLKLIGI